ncbi:MAG: response regulator transcription factor [Acetobacteraceae bacterium]|nr:response regulator transcription factor [Acetobacteraceae bacterium]
MPAILVIEDNPATAEEIRLELTRHGFDVQVEVNGVAGLDLARRPGWSAFVVDRMVPHLDGLSVIRTLRSEGISTPALVLSALDAVNERIDGLRAGGDDYLIKPFALGELTARVEALIRRPASGPQTVLRHGPVEIDLVTRVARRNGRDLELLGREFQILEYLIRRPDQVVTRKMLLEDVFGYRFELKTNLLDVHVGRLRRKLDLPGEVPLLATIRGTGFRLDANA